MRSGAGEDLDLRGRETPTQRANIAPWEPQIEDAGNCRHAKLPIVLKPRPLRRRLEILTSLQTPRDLGKAAELDIQCTAAFVRSGPLIHRHEELPGRLVDNTHLAPTVAAETVKHP